MALKNRTESKAVVTAWAPILDLEATHKPDLRDQVLDNCLFRKDVSSTTTASGTTKTLEFLDIDYVEVTQSNNVAYTLNNIQQGEIKYLKITKTANQTITFTNATDVSVRKAFINTTTVVIYRIINKDGDLYLESINIENDVNNDIKYLDVDIGDWNMDANTAPDVSVSNPTGDKDKIRIVQVWIRPDAGAAIQFNQLLNSESADDSNSGGIAVSDSTILITRTVGGKFDHTDYSDTSYNRGWVTIGYKE